MSAPNEAELERLLDVVYERYCHDFRAYARSSMRRRVEAARESLGCPSIGALRDRVLEDPAAFAAMFRFLTVQVSEMFRDPSYFLALRREVLPRLATYPFIRAWIAGCGAGEEAYSLAILLHEEGLLGRSLLYATDISPAALQAGEAGVYDLGRAAGFGESYRKAGGRGALSDYYTAAYGRVRFDRALRAQIVFADHSLATDGVFAEVHLISCRNVLIYFDHSLRDRAVGLFHDALVPRGFLGLGRRETLDPSRHAIAFGELVPEERIYQRRA